MRHLSSKVVIVVAAIATAVMPLASQAPPQKPSFEPVVIKPAPYGQSVKKLVTYAYGVKDFQIVGGPDWASTDLWDIQSKVEDANDHAPEPLILDGTQPDPFSLMAQSILEDRFQLKAHREVRQLPVYELVVAQGGPKIRLADDQTPFDRTAPPPRLLTGVPRGSYFIGGNRAGKGFEGNAVPLDRLVNILTIETGRTVIDKTGLHGLYDMQMEWTPDSSRIPLTTAMEGRLGLQLVSSTGPVEVLVIESVQKPSEN
jgi:uncharacterized protein (TIGR03435 family)